jgi:demethylmenaquinone methyltransferase/2-methoxy-6-polyprenyl-1,4-benzoquinol methylase
MATLSLPTGAAKRAMVREMFDRIAPRYDALNRLLTLGLDQRWRARSLDAIDIGPDDVIVDLACGTGDLCVLARARGARVLGVDFAREMLRGAQARRVGAALAQADAARLPIRDASASAVTCGFALRNFVALEAVLCEAARVLRPGGRIALLEVDRPRAPILRVLHALWFEHAVPAIGGLVSDRHAYAYLPRSAAYLPPAPELLALVARCGFEAAERRPLLFGAVQLVTARRAGSAAERAA